MKDDELVEPGNPPVNGPLPYDLLVRQSRKLGRAATKTFHDLKHLLNHEISMPSRDQLLSGLSLVPKLKNTKKSEELASLKRMVRKSHEVLVGARTVFPLTLFPHSIIVDRTKITIIKRSFFWSSSVVSIRVEDILNVATDVGPLFGSVTVASRVMNSIDHFQINYLWRGDAIFIKHIIQGYVFALQNNVDVGKLPRKELIEMLSELGHD
jgi:hypothetical protein